MKTDLDKGPWANRPDTRRENGVRWIMTVALIVTAGLSVYFVGML